MRPLAFTSAAMAKLMLAQISENNKFQTSFRTVDGRKQEPRIRFMSIKRCKHWHKCCYPSQIILATILYYQTEFFPPPEFHAHTQRKEERGSRKCNIKGIKHPFILKYIVYYPSHIHTANTLLWEFHCNLLP